MHYSLKKLPVAAAIASALTNPAAAQYCSANQSLANTTKYPNKCQIAQLFSYPGEVNFTAFFAQAVAPDVHWTLMGTHPLAGEYYNKTIFVKDTLERLGNTLVTGTSTLKLVHIVGGGDEEWSVLKIFMTDGFFLPRFSGIIFNHQSEPRISHIPAAHKPIQGGWDDLGAKFQQSVQELHGRGVCKNGLKYDNTFAWVTRWSDEGVIVQVHSWSDSALVARVITENESPVYTYTDQRKVVEPGPVGINCATHS